MKGGNVSRVQGEGRIVRTAGGAAASLLVLALAVPAAGPAPGTTARPCHQAPAAAPDRRPARRLHPPARDRSPHRLRRLLVVVRGELPLLRRQGVDWHAVRDRYRPLVHKDTTRAQLFDIFSRMITPLHPPARPELQAAQPEGRQGVAGPRPVDLVGGVAGPHRVEQAVARARGEVMSACWGARSSQDRA
ncbi:hypothetical protein ACWCY6_12470 [Streptomyces sp. 900105755]